MYFQFHQIKKKKKKKNQCLYSSLEQNFCIASASVADNQSILYKPWDKKKKQFWASCVCVWLKNGFILQFYLKIYAIDKHQ